LFRMFFVKLPQTRHPERSASQIDRLTQRVCGAESKDLGAAYLSSKRPTDSAARAWTANKY
jgi:hypothetical protein